MARRGSPGMVLIIFVIRWLAMLAMFVWCLQHRCGSSIESKPLFADRGTPPLTYTPRRGIEREQAPQAQATVAESVGPLHRSATRRRGTLVAVKHLRVWMANGSGRALRTPETKARRDRRLGGPVGHPRRHSCARIRRRSLTLTRGPDARHERVQTSLASAVVGCSVVGGRFAIGPVLACARVSRHS